jgi:hypothetical protein
MVRFVEVCDIQRLGGQVWETRLRGQGTVYRVCQAIAIQTPYCRSCSTVLKVGEGFLPVDQAYA